MAVQALAEAYREASGAAWLDEQRRAAEKCNSAPLLIRGVRSLLEALKPQSLDDLRRTYTGREWLESLVRNHPGTYPLRRVSYDVNGEYDRWQRFNYELIFRGDNIGEEGEVNLFYHARPILLKKGLDQAQVEIGDDGRHVLHLPENVGIAIKANVREFYDSSKVVLATWIPNLSDGPQSFSHPQGGRFEWNAKLLNNR